MKRVVVVVACGLSLTACSSMPGWMQLDLPGSQPAATTMQFESEPPGAEARTSSGQACRTPCSLSMTPGEFTVDFTLPGYQQQTVPVRMATSNDPPDPNSTADTSGPRMIPNPVFAQLQPTAPPPVVRHRKPAVAHNKPRPKPAPRQAAPRQAPAAAAPAPAPAPTPAPAPAPASPWPPPAR